MKKELDKVLAIFKELEPLKRKHFVEELSLSFSLGSITTYSITETNITREDSNGVKLYNIKDFKGDLDWSLIKIKLIQSTEEQIKDLIIKQNFYYPVCDPYEL